ncbi:hypothetical protein SAMN04487787_101132 [Kosakonia sacchari]|nr:hypothetical protein SAMN04487787_101132 [Kosakonia sacchari]
MSLTIQGRGVNHFLIQLYILGRRNQTLYLLNIRNTL